MQTFGVMRIAAAGALLLVGGAVGALVLRNTGSSSKPSTSQTLGPFEPPSGSQLEQSWRQLDEVKQAEKRALASLDTIMSNFSNDLKKIHPEARAVSSPSDAEVALSLAGKHIANTQEQLRDQRDNQLKSVELNLKQRLETLRDELAAISAHSLADFESRLASVLVLGQNRKVKGIDWIWVPDSGKTRTGGFWASESEIALKSFSETAKVAPKSHTGRSELKDSYAAAARGSSGPSDSQLKARAAKSVSNGRLSWGQIMSGNPGVQVFVSKAKASYNSLKASADRNRSSAASSAAEKKLAKYPSGNQRAAILSPSDAELYAAALQKEDLPSSEWKYRLPTLQEWTVLKSAPGILGIGKPDFSEWVTDNGQAKAVDMNWQSSQPKNPPAPGTVGFRLVLAAE